MRKQALHCLPTSTVCTSEAAPREDEVAAEVRLGAAAAASRPVRARLGRGAPKLRVAEASGGADGAARAAASATDEARSDATLARALARAMALHSGIASPSRPTGVGVLEKLQGETLTTILDLCMSSLRLWPC